MKKKMSEKIDINQTTETVANLLEKIATVSGKEIQANIKAKPYKPKQQYAIVFIANLLHVFVTSKLSRNDLLVLLGYAQLMEFGNHVSISQSDVAKVTGIARANIPRSIKKLKEIGLFYSPESAPNSLYVNPQFIAKGDLKQFKAQLDGLSNWIEESVAAEAQK